MPVPVPPVLRHLARAACLWGLAAGLALAAPIDAESLDRGSDLAFRRALPGQALVTASHPDAAVAKRIRDAAGRLAIAARSAGLAPPPTASTVVIVAADPDLAVYPGGRVLARTGLVNTTGFLDGELAAVLAYALAHERLGHLDARIAARAGEALGAADPNRRAIAVADATATVVATTRFTPEEIAAADRVAIQWLAQAGYDPRAASSAWRILARLDAGIARRTPAPAERIAAIDDLARAAVPAFEQVRAAAAAAPAPPTPPRGTNRGTTRSISP